MQKAIPNTERTIRSVCASMKIEGFQVSKQTQEDCRAILSGRKTADELVAIYLNQYGKKK